MTERSEDRLLCITRQPYVPKRTENGCAVAYAKKLVMQRGGTELS